VARKASSDSLNPRSHNLKTAFKIIGVSRSKGSELVRSGAIRVVYYTEDMPRITNDEIERILHNGLVDPRQIRRRPKKHPNRKNPKPQESLA
jgi:hypothetical protein